LKVLEYNFKRILTKYNKLLVRNSLSDKKTPSSRLAKTVKADLLLVNEHFSDEGMIF
jgi:hypothetical protein